MFIAWLYLHDRWSLTASRQEETHFTKRLRTDDPNIRTTMKRQIGEKANVRH